MKREFVKPETIKTLSNGSNLSNPETLSNRLNPNFLKFCQTAKSFRTAKLCQGTKTVNLTTLSKNENVSRTG